MQGFTQPLFSVDSVLFTVVDGRLKVLMVKRAQSPYEGLWRYRADTWMWRRM